MTMFNFNIEYVHEENVAAGTVYRVIFRGGECFEWTPWWPTGHPIARAAFNDTLRRGQSTLPAILAALLIAGLLFAGVELGAARVAAALFAVGY